MNIKNQSRIKNVTPKDHYEIAGEMQEWLEKMKPYCSYMTDIISAVKGQAGTDELLRYR